MKLQRTSHLKTKLSKIAILLLSLTIFASACSGSGKEFVEDTDSSTTEETSESETETSESEAADSESSSDAEEAESEASAADEEEEEEIECPWDVGWKSGSSAWGTGSSLLEDARLGAHDEYDRFVLEFKSEDPIPSSYNIMWLAVEHTGEVGVLTVDSPAGDVFLQVAVGASYTSASLNASYFSGPYRVTNPLLGNVQEAVSVGDEDGRIVWLLGAAEANGFRVFELEDPARLVVDVCIGDTSTTKGEDCIASGMPPALCGGLFDYTGGYTGPHSELSEECPPVPELTATAFTTTSYFADLDGDGDDEEAFTYYETFDEGMYLRVINGSDKIDYLLASGGTAFVPSGNAVVGAIDLQNDDKPELFVTDQGGSPGSPRGVSLFQIDDCELDRIKNHGTDSTFYLSVGFWSAGGHGYGIDCVSAAPVLKGLHSYPSSMPPVTTWLWTRTTYELLADNTMIEVSVSDEFSGIEVPWDQGFNSCEFE